MPEKVQINDQRPLDTAQLRKHRVFTVGDPLGQVPDVVLASAPLNPRDRPHRDSQRVGIYRGGERVGALNVTQKPSGATWFNDVRIEQHRQGERLGVATYMGILAVAHEAGRHVQSDPAGLSPDSTHLWQSLVRRGIAEVVPNTHDAQGNPRFISHPASPAS